MTVKANRSERRGVGKREKLRGRIKVVEAVLEGYARGNSPKAIASSTGTTTAFVTQVLETAKRLGMIDQDGADQDAEGEGVGRK